MLNWLAADTAIMKWLTTSHGAKCHQTSGKSDIDVAQVPPSGRWHGPDCCWAGHQWLGSHCSHAYFWCLFFNSRSRRNIFDILKSLYWSSVDADVPYGYVFEQGFSSRTIATLHHHALAIVMNQTRIPVVFMRGGTSRGPYFDRGDLPDDQDTLAEVLVSVVGSGHALNIDGIGGGNAVTTKVAMLSPSSDPWADIDYFFAQVSVTDKLVDFKPSCGNILSGVAPSAIEMGLVRPESELTTVKIRAVNTNARIVATVTTSPAGVVYDGDTRIDGVPGSASPIQLQFMDTIGGATGSLLPTGNLVDCFDGVAVTCMDVAMPMVIARATSFDLSGYESAAELDEDKAFMAKLESVRLAAGAAMGLGDVSRSVAPKFGLLAPPRQGGTVTARYILPWNCHPTTAVTGAQCLASCILAPGSVADGLCQPGDDSPATIRLEHPSGVIDVIVNYERDDKGFRPLSAGLIRTARKIADGHVYVPGQVWTGND